MDENLQSLYNKLYSEVVAHRGRERRATMRKQICEMLMSMPADENWGVTGKSIVAGSSHRKVDIITSDCDVLVEITSPHAKFSLRGKTPVATDYALFDPRSECFHSASIVHSFFERVKNILEPWGAVVFKRMKAVSVSKAGLEFDILPTIRHDDLWLVANRDGIAWEGSKRDVSRKRLLNLVNNVRMANASVCHSSQRTGKVCTG